MGGSTTITLSSQAALDSYVSGIRARGIASTEIADSALEDLMAEVLSEYSRYRPQVCIRTFTTTADQQAYTWAQMGDADGDMVLLAVWNPVPIGDEWSVARYIETGDLPNDYGDFDNPMLTVVEQIKQSASYETFRGKGSQLEPHGGSLYLTPVPDLTGSSVYIVYTKPLATIDDIRSSDRDIFLDLVESVTCGRIEGEIATKASASRIKTPEYEMERGSQIRAWRDRAERLKERFISKAQAGFAAAGRT